MYYNINLYYNYFMDYMNNKFDRIKEIFDYIEKIKEV